MHTTTANEVDASFDQIFNSYMDAASFDAEEVTGSFTAAGVAVSEAPEKHFDVPAIQDARDSDWSMV